MKPTKLVVALVGGFALAGWVAGVGEAGSSKKECKQRCAGAIANCAGASLVFGGGAFGAGAKQINRGCQKAVLKHCGRAGVEVCGDLASCVGEPECVGSVTTTTVPGVTTTTTGVTTTTTTRVTTTTTTTIPAGSDYEGSYDFGGMLETGNCDVPNVPTVLFATLSIRASFGTTLSGVVYQSSGGSLFFEDTSGSREWPTWSTETGLCAVETLGGRCGTVRTTMTGLPNPSFDDPPHEVPGSVEFNWTNPACMSRWDGMWTD